jgi:hypothetical protein
MKEVRRPSSASDFDYSHLALNAESRGLWGRSHIKFHFAARSSEQAKRVSGSTEGIGVQCLASAAPEPANGGTESRGRAVREVRAHTGSSVRAAYRRHTDSEYQASPADSRKTSLVIALGFVVLGLAVAALRTYFSGK